MDLFKYLFASKRNDFFRPVPVQQINSSEFVFEWWKVLTHNVTSVLKLNLSLNPVTWKNSRTSPPTKLTTRHVG